MDHLKGRALGQYALVAVVGRGSTATVYQAYQQSLGRYVAVKVLHPNLDPQFDARFEREAQAAAQLHHRNILPIYDYGEEGGVRFFVTQYIENGQSLADVATGGPVQPLDALRLVADLLDALDYAHRKGVIHRDVKPSNVLMPLPDWPLLADFGIAKLLDETSHLTPPGQMVGTAAYLAPERALGRPADARTDLYAVGVVLHELVTGRVPFEASSPASVMMQHVHTPPPPARAINPSVPPAVEALALRALEKEPAQRYQSAAEMLADVRRVIEQVQRSAAQSELAGMLAREVGAPARRYDTVELPNLRPTPASSLPAPADDEPPRRRLALPILALLLLGALMAGGVLALRGGGVSGETAPTAIAQRGEGAAAVPTATEMPPAASGSAAAGMARETAEAAADGAADTATATAERPAPTEEPVPTPKPDPTALPTDEPSPTLTEEPTEEPAPAPAPPVTAPEPGATRIALDDDAWAGGFGGASGPRSYGGRSATWVYGQGTGYETMRAVFTLDVAPQGDARLTVEG
ncbi:MAG: hypothetical protein RLZZ387_5279, partial [Chloroflexota bacterium]